MPRLVKLLLHLSQAKPDYGLHMSAKAARCREQMAVGLV